MKKIGMVKTRRFEYTQVDENNFQSIKQYYGLNKDIEVERKMLLDTVIALSLSNSHPTTFSPPEEKTDQPEIIPEKVEIPQEVNQVIPPQEKEVTTISPPPEKEDSSPPTVEPEIKPPTIQAVGKKLDGTYPTTPKVHLPSPGFRNKPPEVVCKKELTFMERVANLKAHNPFLTDSEARQLACSNIETKIINKGRK